MSSTTDATCFQHPSRQAEVVLTFYVKGDLATVAICHNCRHATAIAALVHEDIISPDYEIIDIDELETKC